ncbi:Ada metal-binding domain-containing protein [Paracoccus ravus]|uniref:Ada metal-binding domain-containing protein n=1 Tax=Paracoccus ravus TaxID=2447760 RepID=UPI001FD707EB|nr:Ada metal-binding domain-containing protein [Paracoccus ravus]
MLFDLPDHQTLYAALLARDDRFDGQAFVCVSTTGVSCRLPVFSAALLRSC